MNNLTTLFWLLAAYSLTLINARPSSAPATRLSRLYMDPANDESFNEINRFDYPKQKEVMEQQDVVLSSKEVTTRRPDGVEDAAPSAAAEEGLMRFMFGLMGNMMRRLISL